MRHQFRCILMVVALCICSATLALGASVTITSTGGGSFAVQGDNMNGVSGIELTIGYDTSAVASPSVSWGSLVTGALTMANTTVPGTIRIAIIRTDPFSGSGPIAAVSFATQNSSGGITSVSAKLVDSKGVNVSASAGIAPGAAGASAASPGFIATPGVPFSQPESPRGLPTTTATTTPRVPTSLGTVTLPDDNQPKSEVQPGESKTAHPPEISETAETMHRQLKQPPAEKSAETIEPVAVKQTIYGSVLDRFRAYRGEKTPAILIELFTKAISPSISQVPAVAISDGKATVRVTVDLSAIKGTSTDFTLAGAKLVSLKKENDSDTWILDALPQVNSLKATVTISNSGSVIEFPLTVVPPAAAVSAKQADFAAFLKDSGAKVPKHDLNGDGRHDYLDDFIYTAHYLIKSSAAAKDTK